MRAYYFDDLPGAGQLPHDSGKDVPLSTLATLGVLYWNIGTSDKQTVESIAQERGYKNRDVVRSSRAALGEAYEARMAMFYAEHMHEDEEIRYVLEGSGFFDVREHPTDTWIRISLTAGDMIVLPAGIYHRFTLDEAEAVEMMRLFKDEPKWIAHNRSEVTDVNPRRMEYLDMLRVQVVGA